MWKENTNPTADDNDGMDSFGPGHGIDLGHATGLSPGSTYKYRVYIKLAGNHYIYSEVKSVTTKSGIAVVTLEHTNNNAAGILVKSNIVDTGGAPIIQRGICWSTGSNLEPDINLPTKTEQGSVSGVLASTATGLTTGKEYHIRAYVTNAHRTSYSNRISLEYVVDVYIRIYSDGDNYIKLECYDKNTEDASLIPVNTDLAVMIVFSYSDTPDITEDDVIYILDGDSTAEKDVGATTINRNIISISPYEYDGWFYQLYNPT